MGVDMVRSAGSPIVPFLKAGKTSHLRLLGTSSHPGQWRQSQAVNRTPDARKVQAPACSHPEQSEEGHGQDLARSRDVGRRGDSQEWSSRYREKAERL